MSGTDNSSLKREVLSLKASIQKMRAALVGIEESVDTILLSIEGTPSGSELPNDRPLLKAALLNDRQPPAKRPKETITLDELPPGYCNILTGLVSLVDLKYTDLKICILRDIQIFMSN